MADQDIPIQSSNTKKFSFYENFDGHYHKVGEIRDLIPQFKVFYYAERRKDPQRSAIKIINDYNAQITPLTFFPWEKQYRLWRKKWDAELLAKRGYIQEQRRIQELIKTRDEQNAYIVPDEETLEMGTKTLAGELLNDALTMLKTDQEKNAEVLTSDEEIKRRNYILNVYNYLTRGLHGKESLRLKSDAKERPHDYLLVIMQQFISGKATPEDKVRLRQAAGISSEAKQQETT